MVRLIEWLNRNVLQVISKQIYMPSLDDFSTTSSLAFIELPNTWDFIKETLILFETFSKFY